MVSESQGVLAMGQYFQDDDSLSLVTLILVLFIMMAAAVGVLAVGFFHIRRIMKSSIVFYGLLGLLLLIKLVGYLYFAVQIIILVSNTSQQQDKQKLISQFGSSYKNAMFVTDFVIVTMFLVLMKEFMALQAEALLDRNSSVIRNVWTVMILLELLTFATFIGLFNFGIVGFTTAGIAVSILNLLPCALYLAINLYTNITMTGAITDSDIVSRLKKTNIRLFWFFISRTIQGSYQIVLLTDIGNTPFFNVILNIEKTNGQPIVVLTCFGIYLVVALLTQLIPYVISIRVSTIQLMVPVHLTLKQSLLSQDTSFINLLKNSQKQYEDNEITLRDFQTLEVLSMHQNSLGVVKKGRLKGRLMVLRTIQTELSKYLLEEIASQIHESKKMDIQGILPIRYSVLEPQSISFITDYYDVNVKKLIDTKRSLQESVRIALSITEVVQNLHRKNLPHGTLKVNNIYVSGTTLKLADHGLLSLKKFMSITKGYTNKSIYTAPELLAGRYSVIVKPTKEGDIYALGMIMFQLFTGITVYRNLPLSGIEASFRDKQQRPKIPNSLPIQLQNLIRNCWQQESPQRPSIQEVGSVIRQFRNKSG